MAKQPLVARRTSFQCLCLPARSPVTFETVCCAVEWNTISGSITEVCVHDFDADYISLHLQNQPKCKALPNSIALSCQGVHLPLLGSNLS